MCQEERGTFEIATASFGSIEALVKDARGNALFAGNDPKRIRIGARHLRLAAQSSTALADLIESVAGQDRARGDKAKKRLAQIDRDIQKHLDLVAIDNVRFAKERGAIRVRVSVEDIVALLRGEQRQELVDEIERLQKMQ